MLEELFFNRNPNFMFKTLKFLNVAHFTAVLWGRFTIKCAFCNNNNNDCLLRLIAAIYRMAELQSYLQNI